jgi:hypothetical protein
MILRLARVSSRRMAKAEDEVSPGGFKK